MNPLLFDHIWQSTVVLAGIGFLTLFFRNNGAHVRHALWTAASLKFLLPFALLNELGRDLTTWLAARPVQPPAVQAVYAASQPFSDGPVFDALPAPGTYLLPVMLVWVAGILVVAAFWLLRWRKLGEALRTARDAGIAAPMPVKFSPTLLEPGLVGIFRPVLLLPEGIQEKLTPAELQSILAHEACHLRRRDNLTAALHMLVEALFWFWPPVWWLGTRLIAEREKACDEAVLAAGSDPQTYAESILKVCKHYVSSPLACASGVSGADLKQRMEDIMRNQIITRLNIPKKTLLAASAAATLALPLAMGVFTAPVFAQDGRGTINETLTGREADLKAAGGILGIARKDQAPSPGLAEALRRYSDALTRGAPDYSVMTSHLQGGTRESLQLLLSDTKRLGALQTITFRTVSVRGWDIYDVRYANGTATYEAAPLVGGKLDHLTWGDALMPSQPQHPGTAAALRKYVDSMHAGSPDYAGMTPELAAIVRHDQAISANQSRSWGAPKAIVYKGGGMANFDLFEVTYEHGTRQWLVWVKDGKLAGVDGPHVGFFS